MKRMLLVAIGLACVSFGHCGERLNTNGPAGVHKVSEPISIDGDLKDWNGRKYDVLGCDTPFEESFSGVFYSGWSESGLFFAAKVFDDDLSITSDETSDFREQDCLELFLDVRGYENQVRMPYGGQWTEFVFDGFSVDGVDGDVIEIDDTDASIVYSDHDWAVPDVERTLRRKKEMGDAWLSMEFEGERICLLGVKSVRGANLRISIDGVQVGEASTFARVSEWGESDVVFDSGQLSPGRHTIKIEEAHLPDAGLLHALIQPDVSGGCLAQLDSASEIGSIAVPLASKKTDNGWNVEGMIPWSLVGGFDPNPGTWIRFAYKLYDADNAGRTRKSKLGLVRHGSNTTLKWMVNRPERFPKVTLEEGGKFERVDAFVGEVRFRDKNWLEIDVKTLTDGKVVEGGLIVRSNNGYEGRFSFRRSSSERYAYLRELVPLALLGRGDVVELSLELEGFPKARKFISVPLAMAREIDRIEAALPERRISELPEYQRSKVCFYKACAIELAEFYGRRKNREIMHYNLLPMYEDPVLVGRYIESYLRHAKLWLESDVAKEFAIEYSQQMWRSEADGSWQSFTLSYPKDYDPKDEYDIVLEFHFDNKGRYSRVGTSIEGIHNEDTFMPRSVSKWRNSVFVQLTGRGNSFQELGDEEIEYVLGWIDAHWGSRAKSIRFYGNSNGGDHALQVAARMIDRPQMVQLTSGTIRRLRLNVECDAYDERELYMDFLDNYSDKARNLANFPIMMNVGEEDIFVASRNRKLLSVTGESQYESQLEVVPGLGHWIPPEREKPVLIAPRIPGVPNRFGFTQNSLRYGMGYGVSVLSKFKAWRPFSVEYEKEGDTLSLQTKNVSLLSINLDEIGFDKRIGLMEVDGQGFEASGFEDASWIVLKRSNLNLWERGTNPKGVFIKRPKLEGPIGDIEREGFIIVYGTKDPAMVPVLLGRARKIVEHRVGSDLGQWSGGRFVVKADSQLTEDEFASRNLWLIGNVAENRIVERIAPSLSIHLSNDAFKVGEQSFENPSDFLEMICLNPISRLNYVYIEAGLSERGYNSDILENRQFDFAVSRIDGRKNRRIARGVFGTNWGLDEGDSIVWEK